MMTMVACGIGSLFCFFSSTRVCRLTEVPGPVEALKPRCTEYIERVPIPDLKWREDSGFRDEVS